ncbi:MAG: mycothiol system anti-sigma-R factor [Acidimicrobiales bacterium]|nr:mycothiol system anti-sigma-R factor [Acidimicrobiales bacterium]
MDDNASNEYKVEDLMGRTNCDDALHTLYHFLDGELTEERRIAIRRHLDECAPCLQAFDFEMELKRIVARCCQDQVPSHLRDKIAQILDEASRGERGNV